MPWQLWRLYDEAIRDFKKDNFKSSVDVSRNFLEKIVEFISSKKDTAKAIFKLYKEGFLKDNCVLNDTNQAISYWCKSKKIYQFIRLYTLFNIICLFGSHDDENPNMNDTLWILHEL